MLANFAHVVRLLVFSILATFATSGAAQAYEEELKALSEKLVGQLEAAGQTNGTVLDFADLQGQATELGRFLAQELSDKLVSSAKKLAILDRGSLQYLLRENKLSAEGLVDPKTTRKLGNLIGIDTLIVGTVTPLGDKIRLSVRGIAVETGKIVGSQSVTLPGAGGLADLYPHGVAAPESASDNGSMTNASSSTDPRGRFRADSIKISGRSVNYHYDDTSASITLQNLSGIAFNAAIRQGSLFIGQCGDKSYHTEVGGLSYYDKRNSEGEVSSEDFTYVPANATVPVGIRILSCPQDNYRKTVDIGLSLILYVSDKTFDIALSATDVPVQGSE